MRDNYFLTTPPHGVKFTYVFSLVHAMLCPILSDDVNVLMMCTIVFYSRVMRLVPERGVVINYIRNPLIDHRYFGAWRCR